MFSAKSHSLASAAVLAAALCLGVSSAHAASKAGLLVAQAQTEPANADQAPAPDKPAATDDTIPPAAPAAGSETNDGADAPAAGDANTATTPEATPPSDATTAAPSTEPPSDASDKADVAPVKQEAPAAAAEPATSSGDSASTVNASQLQIGTAVYGADGAKIGELNGVKSDTSGKVQEILVTDGGAAGINAKVFAVSGDKITGVTDGVKLSLSSEEAKKLPIIDNGNG
jgi:hypothetical protein